MIEVDMMFWFCSGSMYYLSSSDGRHNGHELAGENSAYSEMQHINYQISVDVNFSFNEF